MGHKVSIVTPYERIDFRVKHAESFFWLRRWLSFSVVDVADSRLRKEVTHVARRRGRKKGC